MSTERWLIVRKDGSLVLHEENDGWAFLRNGLQASEEPISANKTLRISHSQWVSTVVPISSMSCGRLDTVTMVQSDNPILGLVAISPAP